MNIKNKYIIGTHVMFYEVEIFSEFVDSLIQATNQVANIENVMVKFMFNFSECLEKIDTSLISKDELKQKFMDEIEKLRSHDIQVRYNFYEDEKLYTIANYRRDFNYFNCDDYDYLIWGETDALFPKEIFQALEAIKDYANSNGVYRFTTFFATRKMWDESWKVLEHPKFTDKPYYETKLPDGSRDDRAFNEPHSIRYTMSLEEMNEINSEAKEFDIQILKQPRFNGCGLVISSDLIKAGANIHRGIFGIVAEDTAFQHSCQQIMGEQYVQFVVKNILLVHNRNHPNKRNYALDMDSDRVTTQDFKGDWFIKLRDLCNKNLNLIGQGQQQFLSFEKDFLKEIDEDTDI